MATATATAAGRVVLADGEWGGAAPPNGDTEQHVHPLRSPGRR